MNMYDDFSNVVSNEESISTESVLDVLKEYAGTISVFDLMAVNAEMIEESKYVQDSYKHKSHEVYAKYFLGRIKDVHQFTPLLFWRNPSIRWAHRFQVPYMLKRRTANSTVRSRMPISNLRMRFARCALLSNWNFNISNQHLYFANFCKYYSTFFLFMAINIYAFNINLLLTKS